MLIFHIFYMIAVFTNFYDGTIQNRGRGTGLQYFVYGSTDTLEIREGVK